MEKQLVCEDKTLKLLRFGDKGAERPGVLDLDGIVRDVSSLLSDYSPEAIAGGLVELLADSDLTKLPPAPAQCRIGAPLSRTNHFLAIGLNYGDHAAEIGVSPPAEPVLFSKAPTCLSGPYDDIVIPVGSVQTDWEVELAVVIGKECDNITEDQVSSHILGYALCNDVSEREYQMKRGGQWMKGKSAPTFGPLGPWIVTADEISDPHSLEIWLDVNGTRMQNGNTSRMLFTVSQIVSYLSRYMILGAGDIITTGTPPGVGMSKSPPQYLKDGDEVRLGIEGLGEQRCKAVSRSR